MKHKILLRKYIQCNIDEWEPHYRSVEFENEKIDELVEDGWVIYGAEDIK